MTRAELELPVDCAECGARVRVVDAVCPGCEANVCRVCGCTDEAACDIPCGWTDETRRLCTNCEPTPARDT